MHWTRFLPGDWSLSSQQKMRNTVKFLSFLTWLTFVGWVGGIACPGDSSTVLHGCECKGEREEDGVIVCINTELKVFPDDLPQTSSLHLEGNNIKNLEAVPYPSLITLTLNNNSIESISPEAFQDLSNLRTLSLDDNKINNIDNDTFAGLGQLRSLTMKNNILNKLEERTFVGKYLQNLEIIKLNNCNISAVAKNAFVDMPSLQHLNIAGNFLHGSLEFIKSQSMPQLQILDLSQCLLRDLEGSPFTDLHSLKHLDLRNNSLSSLSKDSFSGLTNIQTLQLDGNLIHTIEPGTFSDLDKLRDLGLSFNQLSSLGKEDLPSAELRAVSLHDNVWKCDCVIYWMRHNKAIVTSNLNSTLLCAEPPELVNQNFFNLSTGGWHCTENENKFHGHQTAAVVLGVLAALAGSVLLSLLLYRFLIRRRLTRRTVATISGSTSGYRRVNDQGLGMS